MQNSILTYGSISGSAIIGSTVLSVEAGISSVWLGYLVMFVVMGCIFIAVKQYKEQTLGGLITFKQGCLMGLGITAIATTVYVLVWELYLHATDFQFLQQYTGQMLSDLQANGASDAEIEQWQSSMASFAKQYQNPLFRLPLTAIEIMPVGILVTLVSAVTLRNHKVGKAT